MAEGIEISIDVPRELHVEYHSLEDVIQILGIFLDNAIEAAKECINKRIWISIRETEKRFFFRIENTCLKVPDLVEMFERSYSTKGENRGNGLYWARELIGKHPDMYHETQIKNGNVIQKLEIEYS
nr:GHKL domain-containing protein [uncultured Sellimonas sp.]